jgi:hypothetical protein
MTGLDYYGLARSITPYLRSRIDTVLDRVHSVPIY